MLARAPADVKDEIKTRTADSGLDAIYQNLSVQEQAYYHQRMSHAEIEHNHRISAVGHGVQSVIKDPTSIRAYGCVALSLLPNEINKIFLDRIGAR
jgi:hypothetical protein